MPSLEARRAALVLTIGAILDKDEFGALKETASLDLAFGWRCDFTKTFTGCATKSILGSHPMTRACTHCSRNCFFTGARVPLWLATITADGQDATEIVSAEGLAWRWLGRRNPWRERRLRRRSPSCAQ